MQVPPGRGRIRARLASFKSERESVRQCFLFSNHMIVATRLNINCFIAKNFFFKIKLLKF